MEIGYLTALHARLGAKIGDLHAKDSNSFRNRLIKTISISYLILFSERAVLIFFFEKLRLTCSVAI